MSQEIREYEIALLRGEIAETLRALVQSQGLTQRELAERLGLSEARVSRALNEDANLTLDTIAEFGYALGVRFEIVPTPLPRRSETPAAGDPPLPTWAARIAEIIAERSRA